MKHTMRERTPTSILILAGTVLLLLLAINSFLPMGPAAAAPTSDSPMPAQTSEPPVVDGVVDAVYGQGQPMCDTASLQGTQVGMLYTYVDPNGVYVAYVQDLSLVDNTYGANTVGNYGGPTGERPFDEILESDKARFRFTDVNGNVVLEIVVDYFSSGASTTSGYGSLGVTGGDGSVIVGDASWVLAATTSLDYNFNVQGYVLTTNSPQTDANYTPNIHYPNWVFENIYELKIDAAAFGSSGFGGVQVVNVHNSPDKQGAKIVYPEPCGAGGGGVPSCQISASNFRVSEKNVEWDLTNNDEDPVNITRIEITWPDSEQKNKKLNKVKLGDSTIWDKGDDSPPTEISDHWKGDRTLDGSETKTLKFEFEKDADADTSKYQVTVTFSNGCQVTWSGSSTPPSCSVDANNTIQISGKTVSWDITNSSGQPVRISQIQIDWPDGGGTNEKLEKVKLGDAVIWDKGDESPPTTINSQWKGSLDDRSIPAEATKALQFEFKKSANSDSSLYTITVTFVQGCSVSYRPGGGGTPTPTPTPTPVSGAPVVDGIVDIGEYTQAQCWATDYITVTAQLYVFDDPSVDPHHIYFAYVVDRNFVDNTYGENVIGQYRNKQGKKTGHKFNDLVKSDYQRFTITDGDGTPKLDFKVDYLSPSSGTPSGYDSLGVNGGDGEMKTGNPADVYATTSLAYNLNRTGYCSNGNCTKDGVNLLQDSPPTDSSYTPNQSFPNWEFSVIYEVRIARSALGDARLGTIDPVAIHASPSKIGPHNLHVRPCLDFGDLPEPYPTTLENGGAVHWIIGDLKLGTQIDAEDDGQPTDQADGDDTHGTDDEDGVVRTPGHHWQSGGTGFIDVTVSGGNGCLAGWIDWNNDGDFNDSGEQILRHQPVSSGSQTITFPIPSIELPSAFYARFRLYPSRGCPSSTSPTGWAFGGEVEDYYWTFGPTAVTLTRLEARSEAAGDTAPSLPTPAALALLIGGIALGSLLVRRRMRAT